MPSYSFKEIVALKSCKYLGKESHNACLQNARILKSIFVTLFKLVLKLTIGTQVDLSITYIYIGKYFPRIILLNQR